jgi:hypothetical protein
MFNTPDYDDRMRMVKALGYGGDIPPLLAAFANQDLPKQYAILKKNKESPVRIRIPDVKPVPISQKEVDAYVAQLLEQPWYLTKEQIQDQINARSIQANIPRTQPRKVDESETTSEASVPRPVQRKLEKGIRPDNKKSSKPPPKRPIKI